jgi:hypothetical protein
VRKWDSAGVRVLATDFADVVWLSCFIRHAPYPKDSRGERHERNGEGVLA